MRISGETEETKSEMEVFLSVMGELDPLTQEVATAGNVMVAVNAMAKKYRFKFFV